MILAPQKSVIVGKNSVSVGIVCALDDACNTWAGRGDAFDKLVFVWELVAVSNDTNQSIAVFCACSCVEVADDARMLNLIVSLYVIAHHPAFERFDYCFAILTLNEATLCWDNTVASLAVKAHFGSAVYLLHGELSLVTVVVDIVSTDDFFRLHIYSGYPLQAIGNSLFFEAKLLLV